MSDESVSGKTAATRLAQMLDRVTEQALREREAGEDAETWVPTKLPPIPKFAAMVRAYDLVMHPGARDRGGFTPAVLRSVTLELRATESAVLLGPRGAGKTTLMGILGMILRPDEGFVLLGGIDGWDEWDGARARLRLKRIGWVCSQPHLMLHLSVRDNVALPRWRMGDSRGDARDQASELLQRMGLAKLADRGAWRLSRVDAQKVSVARALINKPAVVLADEPTRFLDAEEDAGARNAILDHLFSACKRGAALLVATRDPDIAKRAKRVLHIRDGVVTEPDPPKISSTSMPPNFRKSLPPR